MNIGNNPHAIVSLTMALKQLLFLVLVFATLGLNAQPQIVVLGTAQDGGYPQMGCTRTCCMLAHTHDSLKQFVVSLALVDPQQKKWWLFEATPDIKEQLHLFAKHTNHQYNFLPDGIFLTHSHMGHYTGLLQLGREVMNSNRVPVYGLPRLKKFLETNGPWSQLVSLQNIVLVEMNENAPIVLPGNISVNALQVPHRDEFSETSGFKIITPSQRYLFIPDIDKWSKWNRNIVEEVKSVDIAFLDATFFSADELPNRNMSEVPHPLVMETMSLFQSESKETKRKINFIHFNHTNPLLYDTTKQHEVRKLGFSMAKQARH
jgi:pyrroloquinoline quinone biosynthesis protein B